MAALKTSCTTRTAGFGSRGEGVVTVSSIRVRGLKALALRLHDLGFNVVPVGPDKRPLCKWSSREIVEIGVREAAKQGYWCGCCWWTRKPV